MTWTVVGSLVVAIALVSSSPTRAEPRAYVGVKKCKSCHGKELYGDQVGVWRANNIHANSYVSLASEAQRIEQLGRPRRLGLAEHPAELKHPVLETANAITNHGLAIR